MKVREIMTSEGLATATLDTTLAEISERMRDENVGAIPIVDEDDKLAGIITDRDIVVRAIAEGEDPTSCTAEEILSERMHTIHPEAELEEAADLMARHQIRRLPVVDEEVIIGMISLGDLAVKSGEDEAGDALEDISSGVREDGGRQRGKRSQAQSSGEEVAEEEAEYQRRSGGRQAGSTRAVSANAGRVRNQSKGQQSIANDIVDVEGEEEPDFQNAGSGQTRQRGNQRDVASTRQTGSVRGRQGGDLRESSGGKRSQGISNRSQKEESQRQQKVTPMRAESRTSGRGKQKRRAS